MFKNISPNFGMGRILKKEMLENLRDYPRDFTDIFLGNFSDGVIAGSELIVGKDKITVKKGIVKFNGRIYMMTDEYSMPYYPTNREAIIKIKFTDQEIEQDYKFNKSSIHIEIEVEAGENEIELGRFKLKDGAFLRSTYTDFYDFTTEFNTINIINCQYAGIGKTTLNPLILEYFSRILLKFKSENYYDISLGMLFLNQNHMERDVIIHYISNRLGVDYKEYTNKEIYKFLTMIAKEVESGMKRKAEVRQVRQRTIVD